MPYITVSIYLAVLAGVFCGADAYGTMLWGSGTKVSNTLLWPVVIVTFISLLGGLIMKIELFINEIKESERQWLLITVYGLLISDVAYWAVCATPLTSGLSWHLTQILIATSLLALMRVALADTRKTGA